MKNNPFLSLIPLGLVSMLLSGCMFAPRYHISVNGFLDRKEGSSIEKGATFFVLDGENQENPLLDGELKQKVHSLLQDKGYNVSPLEEAGYVVRFRYSYSTGIKHVTRYESYPWVHGYYYGPYWYRHPWIHYGGSDRTTYTQELHHHDLILSIFDAVPFRKDRTEKVIWVGEAQSRSPTSDLRTALTYMLIALSEHVGKDTSEAVRITIRVGDPRVQIF